MPLWHHWYIKAELILQSMVLTKAQFVIYIFLTKINLTNPQGENISYTTLPVNLVYFICTLVYLDYEQVMELCKTFNILYCKPLFCGCFEQAQNYQLEFQSTIFSMFSLPKLSDCDNLAEGIVIKPLKNISLPTKKGIRRVIYKRKHPKFIETKSKFLPQSDFSSIYGGDVLVAKYELFALLNENRIQSAVSKSGYPKDDEQISSLKSLIMDDIFDEYVSCNHEEFSKLSSGTVCLLRNNLGDELSEFLENEFSLKTPL